MIKMLLNKTLDKVLLRLSPSSFNRNANLMNLTDTFGRNHDYLRISLTERCNLRCKYILSNLYPNKVLSFSK